MHFASIFVLGPGTLAITSWRRAILSLHTGYLESGPINSYCDVHRNKSETTTTGIAFAADFLSYALLTTDHFTVGFGNLRRQHQCRTDCSMGHLGLYH